MERRRKARKKLSTPEEILRMAERMVPPPTGEPGTRGKSGPKPDRWRFKTIGEAEKYVPRVVNAMRDYDAAVRIGRDPRTATPTDPMPGITPDVGQKILNAIAIFVQTKRGVVEQNFKEAQAAKELDLKERQLGRSEEEVKLRAIIDELEKQIARLTGMAEPDTGGNSRPYSS